MVQHTFALRFPSVCVVLCLACIAVEAKDCDFEEEFTVCSLQGLSSRSCVNVGAIGSVWYYTLFPERPYATEVQESPMMALPEMYSTDASPAFAQDSGAYTFFLPKTEVYQKRKWNFAVELGGFVSPRERDWEARSGVLLLFSNRSSSVELGPKDPPLKLNQKKDPAGFISWYNIRLEAASCDHVILDWDMRVARWRTMLDYTVKTLPECFLSLAFGVEGLWGRDEIDCREYLDVDDTVQFRSIRQNGQVLLSQTMLEYRKQACGPTVEFGSIWEVTPTISVYGMAGYTLLWSAEECVAKNEYWLRAREEGRTQKTFPYAAYYTHYMPVWDVRAGVEWNSRGGPCGVTAALGWKGSYLDHYYYRNDMKDAFPQGDEADGDDNAYFKYLGAGKKEYTSLSLGGLELHFMVRY